MTRDAELSARDLVALVRSGLPHETDIGVLQVVVRQAISALYLFTPGEQRARGTGRLRGVPAATQATAPPGSDHQLALYRAFVSIARTEAQLDAVARTLTDGPDLTTV